MVTKTIFSCSLLFLLPALLSHYLCPHVADFDRKRLPLKVKGRLVAFKHCHHTLPVGLTGGEMVYT